MPRPRTGETPRRIFRLGPETLGQLAAVARWLERQGKPHTLTDAVRAAAQLAAEKISEKMPKRS